MIVGLSGYAQVGKDTVGEMLAEHGFTRIAFADKMKAFAYALDPVVIIDRDDNEAAIRLHHLVDQVGWDKAKSNPDVRQLLQRLGTDAGRSVFGEDFWVDLALGDLYPITDTVVTDVRFPNEALYIQRCMGMVVRIARPGYDAPNDHASEHALNDWVFDYHLANDGDLDDLRGRVKELSLEFECRTAPASAP